MINKTNRSEQWWEAMVFVLISCSMYLSTRWDIYDYNVKCGEIGHELDIIVYSTLFVDKTDDSNGYINLD